MEKRRFSGEEKYQVLEEAHQPSASIAEVCRRHQISTSLYYHWESLAKKGALESLNGRNNHKGKKGFGEIERLRAKISRMRSVISEITEENLVLKKNLGE